MSVNRIEVDPRTDWRRTNPDRVVYVPRGAGQGDEDNEHFLVFPAPHSDELLALWTQSSCEGRGDNHLVLARSADGVDWSPPSLLAGAAGGEQRQASWGFPIVSARRRIYVFYLREADASDVKQHSGGMGVLYSDDNAATWRDGGELPVPRNELDHPDPRVPRNWIVWQKPIRDRLGRPFAGVTHWSSPEVKPHYRGWVNGDSRCVFLRFDNLDEVDDPADLSVTWLPRDGLGLAVTNPVYPDISVAQEPAVVLLPDGWLFAVMRTMTGSPWWSVSGDDGETWREPAPLLHRDGGERVLHPMSPSPLYALADGRFLLFVHNNDGARGEHSQYDREWRVNHANFIRNPLYLLVGEHRPEAEQPVWFSEPHLLLDTGDVPVGPKDTAEVGTYPTLLEWHGERVLWYPDRKYYLLGKAIGDELLAGLRAP